MAYFTMQLVFGFLVDKSEEREGRWLYRGDRKQIQVRRSRGNSDACNFI